MDGKGDNAKFNFWTPAVEYAYDTNRFYEKLECIVDDPVLSGDYNSAAAMQLIIAFTMCRDRTLENDGYVCQDEAVIKHWLARKFILVLENRVSFDKENVENQGLLKESVLVWNVVSPQIRSDYYNYIDLTSVSLNDEIWDAGMRTVKHDIFETRPGPFRLWDFPDDVHTVITYELNRDLSIIKRKVFSILDFLGSIGGLAGALIAIFSIAIVIFQYKATIFYMGNNLYKMKDGDEVKPIDPGCLMGIWLSLQRVICVCSCCHSK